MVWFQLHICEHYQGQPICWILCRIKIPTTPEVSGSRIFCQTKPASVISVALWFAVAEDFRTTLICEMCVTLMLVLDHDV